VQEVLALWTWTWFDPHACYTILTLTFSNRLSKGNTELCSIIPGAVQSRRGSPGFSEEGVEQLRALHGAPFLIMYMYVCNT
jgi:hypothetical protein